MRRLPIYFVLDVSESMAGTPLEYLQEGLNRLIRALRTDPYALETVHISIIAFAGQVKTLVPLTELFAFFPPQLPLGAGTAIGAALDYTATVICQELQPNCATAKGDYQPIVYFMSDGSATDNVEEGIAHWQEKMGNRVKFIAVGIGKHADLSVFRPISEEILRLEQTGEQDFKQFVDWISQSVSAQSRSVGTGSSPDKLSLEKAQDYDILKVIYDGMDAGAIDEHFVILNGQCSTTGRPYLLKYERIELPDEIYRQHPNLPETVYDYSHACALDEQYYAWSDQRLNLHTVNVNALLGGGACPHCANRYTLALCSDCSQLMCIPGAGKIRCPNCHSEQEFVYSEGDDAGFNISRSSG